MNIYVSHSARSQIGPLRDLLRKEGASFRDSFDPSAISGSSERVHAGIQAADAVIAVIDGEAANVLFEIGVAIGLRKPVLALLTPGVTVPSFVAPLTYLTSDLADSDVLRLAVRRFLDKSKDRPSKVRETGRKSPPLLPDRVRLRGLAKRLSRLRKSGDPFEFEHTVSELLRASRITAIKDQEASDRGVDFAVWSDSLRGSLGSPILIELKAAKLNNFSFRTAYSNLARQVQESGSAAGLLLYLDESGMRFAKPATWIPSVLWFDAEDFAKELSKRSFGEVLAERRNKIVHGFAD
jgi:hypothetical protein